MELYEAMSTLRAVRRLRTDPIPPDVLERVLLAATWAPTGGNTQPFRILAVTDADAKRQLGSLYAERWARYADGYRRLQARMNDDDRTRQEKILRSGDYLARHFHEVPALVLFCFNPDRMAITDRALDRVSVVGGGSVYPAVQNLLLAARAEGLGCVLTTLLCECEPEVRRLLGIPDPWGTAAAVPLGYPKLRGHGAISRRGVATMCYRDRWGERWQ